MTKASATIDVDALKVAGESASKYITTIDEGGIKVHDAEDEDNYIQLTSGGMDIFQNINDTLEKVASFNAAGTQIGRVGHAQVNIETDALSLSNESGKCFEVAYNLESSSTTYSITAEKTWTGGVPVIPPQMRGTNYTVAISPRPNTTFSVSENRDNSTKFTLEIRNAYDSYSDFTGATNLTEGLIVTNSSAESITLQIAEGFVNFTVGTSQTKHFNGTITRSGAPAAQVGIRIDIAYDASKQTVTMEWGAISGANIHTELFSVHFPSIIYEGYENPTTLHIGSWDTSILTDNNRFGSSIGTGLIPCQQGLVTGKYNIGDFYNLFEVGDGSITTRKNVFSISGSGMIVNGRSVIKNDLYVRTNDITNASNGSQVNPIGTIVMFAGLTAPTGWLLCQGQAVSRTTYAGLFAVIGTVYGAGNGSTTFNLPDLKGRVPLGAGSNSANTVTTYGSCSAGTVNQSLGAKGGEATHILTPSETAMKAHSHGTSTSGKQFVVITSDTSMAVNRPGSSGTTSNYFLNVGTSTNPFSRNTNTDSTTAANGSAHINMQPYAVVNYIICAF